MLWLNVVLSGDGVLRIARLSHNIIEFQLHDLCEVSDSVLRIARHNQLQRMCEVSE